MPHPTASLRAGFTLIELAIVLAVLGLLVGGVVAGQSLIRNSELKTILTEAQQYKSAAVTFRDKYMSIPGDFAEADASFGGTDGDGDSVLENAEIFQFWRHLQMDGQIEGNFSGSAGSGGASHAQIGTNVPRSSISTVGWGVGTSNFVAPDASSFATDYGNYLNIGASTATAATTAAFLEPEEAWNIDTKIDDGKPGTGDLIARFWDTCTDAASNGSATASHRDNANYLLSDSTIQCALHFIKAF